MPPRRPARVLLAALLTAACTDPVAGTDTDPDTAPGTSTGDVSTSTGDPPTTGGPDLTTGTDPATTDEPTTGGPACATLLCGAPAQCCGADEACVEHACAPACASGVRCGDACCDDGDLCLDGACVAPLGACAGPADCDPGAVCDPVLQQCIPAVDPSACGFDPGDAFALVDAWAYDAAEVGSFPAVADLDADGVADVVVTSIRATGDEADYALGELIRLDGPTGAEVWRIPHDPPNQRFGSHGRASPAIGDVSGDGRPDIVYAGRPSDPEQLSRVHAVDADGELLWTARNPDDTPAELKIQNGAAVLVNLDDDPQAEVAFGAALLDHDGLLVWNQDGKGPSFGSPHAKNMPDQLLYTGGLATFADLDGDDALELLTGREAWEIDWQPGDPPVVALTQKWKNTAGSGGDGWPAVADLDLDGDPEVVLVAWPDIKVLDGATGELWCGVDPTGQMCEDDPALRTPPVLVPGGNLGGPAAIADFDGDGRPEFALTTGPTFRVYDLNRAGEQIVKPANDPAPAPGAVYTRWAVKVQDDGSASSGAAAFDFLGDGAPEVVYQDECYLRILAGDTGQTLARVVNSSGTVHEYPVVADLDADALAELLVVANHSNAGPNADCLDADPDFATRAGVYAYRGALPWSSTRPLWPVHDYHVTNVDDAGNPPVSEQANWLQPGRNDFRQAPADPVPLPGAPDLSVSLAVLVAGCPDEVTLRATVFNLGEAAAPAGVAVTFHLGVDAGAPELGVGATDVALAPGGSAVVELVTAAPDGPANYFADVDGDQQVVECLEANNGALVFGAACP
jgi:hypothetical protein